MPASVNVISNGSELLKFHKNVSWMSSEIRITQLSVLYVIWILEGSEINFALLSFDNKVCFVVVWNK